jgi:FkbM family methyltransferase
LIGERGTWILVEPASECCALLRQIKSVEILEVAVGAQQGKAMLYSPADGSVLASLYERQDSFVGSAPLNEREVTVTTIDDILDERAIPVVDLAKMDLEGHELFAMRGAERSLRSHRIRVLTFEFGSANVNSRTFFRDFWNLLSGYNYRIERICPGGKTVPVTEYYEDLEYFRGATNYIAIAR